MRPAFLITVDAEGDDLWSKPRVPTTRNARFLPRFQALADRYGLPITWLSNDEIVRDDFYREMLSDAAARGGAEIGMHLHAWHQPPDHDLTGDDTHHQPYLFEYPEPVVRAKVAAITRLIEDRFGVSPVSHRAGRWGFDRVVARALADEGYRADCSVAPRFSFRSSPGAPQGSGGPDFTAFPDRPYRLDLSDISRPGDSRLWEIPTTIHADGGLAGTLASRPGIVGKVGKRMGGEPRWLRCFGGDRERVLRVARDVVAQGHAYGMFMIHSSELMPGGSPYFRDERAVEALYEDLEALFAYARDHYRGRTLGGFVDDLEAA